MDVILGATLAEARYWKGHFARTVPNLDQAEEFSTFQHPNSFVGLNVRHIYVAPGAQEAPHFHGVLENLKFRQRKSGNSGDPIVLSSKGAM